MATSKEYGLGEFDFPRGWFMVASAGELSAKPISARYFGQDVVLYRGASGSPVMLDAYCPHMGTHMGKNTTSYVVIDGQVEGDSIRCPYHAWRFGPDGKCNNIPYFDGPIPEAAKVKSWPLRESFGCVFVWHDPEGGEPDYDLPTVAEWDDPSWVRWADVDHLGMLNCHPQEVVDNMTDSGHLGPVHGSVVEYFHNEFDGVVCRQMQGGGHKTLVSGNAMLETDTWYTGPGVLLSRMTGMMDSLMLITHTPVDDGSIKAWHGLLVKSANIPPTEADIQAARDYQASSCAAFSQDFEIWSAKRPCFQVLQLPTDGPFGKLRIWYRQFFNPRANAKATHKQIDGIYTVRGMPPHPSRREAA